MAELDIRTVRYFLAVVEHRGFTRAAAALHLSQPALSQAVRRLESTVGAELIERATSGSRDGLRLTAAGKDFHPAAVDLVLAAERAAEAVAAAVGPASLTVGFGTDTPRALTRRVLRIAAATTQVEVRLQHIRWGLERRALGDREVDLTFIQAPPGLVDPVLAARALDQVGRVAVFARDHPLAARERLSIAELADEAIVDAGSNRAYWLVDPRPDGTSPRVVGPPAYTVDEMLAHVSAGEGMAITSSTVAATNRSDELSFVPIHDLEPATIYLAARADDRRPAVRALLRDVRTSIDE